MVRDFFVDIQIVVIYIELMVIWQLCIYLMASTWGKRGEKEIYGSVSAGVNAFLLCYSFYKLMALVNIYDSNPIFRILGRFALLAGAAIFIVILNWIFFKQIFKNVKFRRIYVATLVLSMIIAVIFYYAYSTLPSLIVLLGFLFFHVAIVGYFSIKWFRSIGEGVKKYMFIFVVGAFMFIIGASAARVIQFFPEIRAYFLITYIMEILGIFMMGVGIWGLPILSELDWKSKLIHLYIIYSNGLVLYETSFEKGDEVNPVLVGSGLTGVVAIIKEMTHSEERLSVIQQGERNIVLEYGEYVNMALIVKEDLRMFHYKLQTLLERFEKFFNEILPTWKGGNIDIYKPARVLVEQIFEG